MERQKEREREEKQVERDVCVSVETGCLFCQKRILIQKETE